jgi:hypothetical protein
MPENRWVAHIKKFARDNNLSYGCAMSDPKIKDGYIPAPKKGKKGKKVVEFEKLEQAFPDTAPKAKNVVIQARPAKSWAKQRQEDDEYWENEQTLNAINKADAKKKAKTEKRRVRTGTLKLLRKSGWQDYTDARGEEVIYDNDVLLDFLENWLAGGDGEDIIGDPEEREAIIDDWKHHELFQMKEKKEPKAKAPAKAKATKSPAPAPAKSPLSATDERLLARAKHLLSQMDSMRSMGIMMNEDQRDEIEDTIRRLDGRGYSGGVVLPKGYDRELLRRTGDPLFL